MSSYFNKLKYVLPTYLLVVFITVTGLALIRWLFFIQFSVMDTKESVWEIWIPCVFPWIPITIWLRPKFRLLKFKKDNDKRSTFFQVISWLMLAAMLFFSQTYLTTATGKLETLRNITVIGEKTPVRYYKLNEFDVGADYGASYADVSTIDKNNKTLQFDLFFVAPITSVKNEKIGAIPKYWYGVKFRRRISNRFSKESKEEYYNEFYKECVVKMNKYDFHALDHFERLPKSDDNAFFLKAVELRIKQTADRSFTILKPIFSSYESRNGHKLFWIFGSFGIGMAVLLFLLIWPECNYIEIKRQLSGKKRKPDELERLFSYMIPKNGHFMTALLIDFNLLFFMIIVLSGNDIFSPDDAELLEWGASRRTEVINGEWWRLFTAMFLQAKIVHLLLNLYGLVIAAVWVEPILGRKKYIAVYLLSGLCAGFINIMWYDDLISMGASGAVFGVYGALFGLMIAKLIVIKVKNMMAVQIGIYLAISLLWAVTGGIDIVSQFGGLLFGALIGLILYKLEGLNKKGERQRANQQAAS